MGLFDDLPQQSKQQASGGTAEAQVAAWVSTSGHIFRHQSGENDFGIDGELEILKAPVVTAQLVKIQVKGVKEASFAQGTHTCTVNVAQKTINYWSLLRLPVIAILWCHETHRAFWTWPKTGLVDDAVKLTFDEADQATGNEEAFFGMLHERASRPSNVEVLEQVPFVFESLAEIEQIGDLDLGTRLDVARSGLVSIAYETVRQAREVLGLPDVLIPWSDWTRRQQRVESIGGPFGSDGPGMLDCVAGEAVLHLRPLLLEVITKMQEVDLTGFPMAKAFLAAGTEHLELPPHGLGDPASGSGGPSIAVGLSADRDLAFDQHLHHLGIARLAPLS